MTAPRVSSFEEFFAEVTRTSDGKASFEARLSCDGLGLCGEAAEFLDALEHAAFDVSSSTRTQSTTYNETLARAYVREAGDVLWYAVHIYALLGGTPRQLERAALYETARSGPAWAETDAGQILREAARVADMVKKIVHHGRPAGEFREAIFAACERIVALVREALSDRGVTLVAALRANVEKLHQRFPDGQWNPADAAAKRDER